MAKLTSPVQYSFHCDDCATRLTTQPITDSRSSDLVFCEKCQEFWLVFPDGKYRQVQLEDWAQLSYDQIMHLSRCKLLLEGDRHGPSLGCDRKTGLGMGPLQLFLTEEELALLPPRLFGRRTRSFLRHDHGLKSVQAP